MTTLADFNTIGKILVIVLVGTFSLGSLACVLGPLIATLLSEEDREKMSINLD